jgi:hypothetical protein
MAKAPASTEATPIGITPPLIKRLDMRIIGTSPLVINRFSEKAQIEMMAKHAAGSQARKGKAREAKDFNDVFNGARHISSEGWDGVHAGAIRNAMISACRLVSFKMTLAKMSLFVDADGYDRVDGIPLCRIIGGEPERTDMPVRNQTGVIDIRTRPMWREWAVDLRIKFDADQFSATDVANLVARVGAQVGIGEGRPDSKQSAGVGWGHFEVATS